MEKIKCAIIGPGNIGMNLLYKIKRSNILECTLFVGRNKNSKNLIAAKKMGFNTSSQSVQALIDNADDYDIAFDATTAESHKTTAAILKKLNKYAIDLTPSKVGRLCVPCLNWESCLDERNVNMVTCGGQSMVPIAHALVEACPKTKYIESVSTISSKSAGPGTRANIDDYIETTGQALREFTGVSNTKAMIVLNPADPPIIMRNTLYAIVEQPNIEKIRQNVYSMTQLIEKYIPGFRMIVEPTFLKDNIIATTVCVEGCGDFLPRYAGNLDIITCAAIEMAEHYAGKLLEEQGGCIF